MKRIWRTRLILWHSKHELTHLIIGVGWTYLLVKYLGFTHYPTIYLALFGSLLPDIEHVYHIFVGSRGTLYSTTVRKHLRKRQLASIARLMETNHKDIYLPLHNVFWMLGLSLLTFLFYYSDHYSLMIVISSMVLHYAFDLVDDIYKLRRFNPNWFRRRII